MVRALCNVGISQELCRNFIGFSSFSQEKTQEMGKKSRNPKRPLGLKFPVDSKGA
jgi:hypothetical protein